MSKHVKKYTKNISKRAGKEKIDPDAIEKGVGDCTMQKRITDVDARVNMFCADFFDRLQRIGCAHLPTINQKKSVRLILERFQPPALKKDMRQRMEYGQYLEKYVKRFISEMTTQKINWEAFGFDRVEKREITRRNTRQIDMQQTFQ